MRARTETWLRRATILLAVAVWAGLVVLGLTKLNLHAVGTDLGRARLAWVGVAFVPMVATFLARGESWFVALRVALPDARLGRSTVTRVLLIGMAGSTLAPARVGEAARVWLIARRAGGLRDSLARTVGTLLSQTLLNLLALLILAIVALAGGAIPGSGSTSLVTAIALPVAAVAVLGLAPWLVRRGRRRRPRNVWVRRAIEQLAQLRAGLSVFSRPGSALHSAVFQLTGWTCQCAACYAMLRAFGLQRTGIVAAAAVLVAVNIAAILPLTPSNIGVFQAACIAVLARYAIPTSQGFAYGLLLQGVEIVTALVLGLPSLLREGLTFRDLKSPRPGPLPVDGST